MTCGPLSRLLSVRPVGTVAAAPFDASSLGRACCTSCLPVVGLIDGMSNKRPLGGVSTATVDIGAWRLDGLPLAAFRAANLPVSLSKSRRTAHWWRVCVKARTRIVVDASKSAQAVRRTASQEILCIVARKANAGPALLLPRQKRYAVLVKPAMTVGRVVCLSTCRWGHKWGHIQLFASLHVNNFNPLA